ncbi:hypothetical protein [Microbacterium yannicii]|uniref:hypothetical protein n=1 Tax=Microbacterium yannicii TaxID=671622 RepID=UPI000313A97B|nr:hypothetical protein [Microbacterium yannicii]
MIKKTLSVVGIAAALILGGSAAAVADYTVDAPVAISDTTPAPGQPITITASNLEGLDVVTFSTSGAGASLASIVLASGSGVAVDKEVVNGSASAVFTASQEGTFVVTVSADGEVLGSTTLVVDAANAGTGTGTGGTGGSGTLPATGGNVPGAVIWAGVGAVGLGGIAVAAVAARRRAASQS